MELKSLFNRKGVTEFVKRPAQPQVTTPTQGNQEEVKQPVMNNASDSFSMRSPTPPKQPVVETQAPSLNKPAIGEVNSPMTMDVANAERRLKNLYKMPEEQRALTGGMLGATVGASTGGQMGALLGAGLGSVMARGAAQVQSGEYQRNISRNRIQDTMRNLGILNNDYTSTLGGTNRYMNSPDNVVSGEGGATRTPYDVDVRNPFANRARDIATPLASFIAQGMLNDMDTGSVRDTEAYISNMLTDGAQSYDEVRARATAIADRLGLDQDKFNTYFSRTRNRYSAEDATRIRKGLDRLYGSKL